MNLSKDHWFVKFYMKAYALRYRELTSNFCTFFWNSLIAVALFPFYILTFLMPEGRIHLATRILIQSLSIVLYVSMAIIGHGIWNSPEEEMGILEIINSSSWWMMWLVYPLSIIALVAVGATVAVSILWFSVIGVDMMQRWFRSIGEEKGFFGNMVQGVKEKKKGICPRINWK